jgi:chloride channel 7
MCVKDSSRITHNVLLFCQQNVTEVVSLLHHHVTQAVGDGTGIKPIYESLMELKGLPFLESHPDSLAHHITAAEAAGHPAVAFTRVERVSAVVDVLKHTKHNGFAVIERGMDGEQHIMGIVLRSQLVVLLKSRRCFQPTSFVSEVRERSADKQAVQLTQHCNDP